MRTIIGTQIAQRMNGLRRRIMDRLSGRSVAELEGAVERLRLAVARVEIEQKAAGPKRDLVEYEAQVYSQNGEDGIIQHLIRSIPIASRSFVEFGVESYQEANTRFLLVNNNWRGLVIDGSGQHIARIKNDPIYWKHDLTAVCSFIDRDNIEDTIRSAGFEGDIGLLSVDIDGNDYWVWQAINCVRPSIVVVEYNAVFGAVAEISVPYDPAFRRNQAHHSNLFYGASLAALAALGREKGYQLVGSNSAGNNAFFVRRDLGAELPDLTASQAFVQARFRESRGPTGELTYFDAKRRRLAIEDLDVINTRTNALTKVHTQNL